MAFLGRFQEKQALRELLDMFDLEIWKSDLIIIVLFRFPEHQKKHTRKPLRVRKSSKSELNFMIGWWLNHPSEKKYMLVTWIISPGIGVKIKNTCLNHHLNEGISIAISYCPCKAGTTCPKTNMSPSKGTISRGNLVFQASSCREVIQMKRRGESGGL